MSARLIHYVSTDEDSARWEGFGFRDGDIVVSSRSKHGTTWVQTILLLLIHRQVELPAPLSELSPWLDHLVEPRDAVLARLERQRHRRVIKTHTPLDGVPLCDKATYVVVGRHPLDAAVSLYHQGFNIDRERLHRLTGAPESPTTVPPQLQEWLAAWIARDADPLRELDSLPGVLRHLSDAWSRRHAPNVVLVHFDELLGDLKGAMVRLARLLGLPPPNDELLRAATFAQMRRRAARLVPDPVGILRDPLAFFREGRSGAGRELLGPHQRAVYDDRVLTLAPADLIAWLHP